LDMGKEVTNGRNAVVADEKRSETHTLPLHGLEVRSALVMC
jgi:hypothetical protein